MAEKNNENRFWAMLERRGIVRKTDTEEPSDGRAPGDGGSLKFDSAFDRDSDWNYPAPKPKEENKEQEWDEPFPIRFDQQPDSQEPDQDEQPPEKNYTDFFLNMDDLYDVLAIKADRADTVYLVEEYLKTLPESLPEESRREIVIKIIAASGFEYERLIGDGVLRVKMLKDYAGQFAKRTDDYIAEHTAELEELQRQIDRVKGMIEERKTLHKQQFFAIENEAQRLRSILTFISGQ